MMQDRMVTVQVELKASQVEDTRRDFAALEQFPAYAWHYADAIEKLMLKEQPDPEDGAELAKLVALLKVDCVAADQTVKNLKARIGEAMISDLEGRGKLQ